VKEKEISFPFFMRLARISPGVALEVIVSIEA
jgi:hypothetical protein